ncbi:MAG TPA: hypothetical protein VF181_09190 [Balneolaceae bacterium]
MASKNSLIVTFIIFIGMFASCDNSLDAFDERGLYSVHGYLGIFKESNYIRIKELRSPLVPDSTRAIDATVTLQNLRTGESEILQDSVVQFDDIYTHNFRTTLDIVLETTYRLMVERSDGHTLKATATMPPFIAQTKIMPTGGNCLTYIKVTFIPVKDRKLIRSFVGFSYKKRMYWVSWPEARDADTKFTYLYFRPQTVLERTPFSIACGDLDTDSLYIKYYHYGPDYFDDTVDDTLRVPGGAGEFGGLYQKIVSFHIDTSHIFD